MGKGFNNYMCKKFFHPASRDNLKRVWMAEQKADAYKKKQEELRVQYEKEQELYNNKAMLSKESKDKLSVNFMYEPPPGAKKEREREDDEPEYKFEWQRKFNAPREEYCKGDSEIRDQPFGIQVRNVRCIKCHKWGHINTDKECPLFKQASVSQVAKDASDPLLLVQQMKEDGLAMKKSALATQHHIGLPSTSAQNVVQSEEEDTQVTEEDLKLLKSLSTKKKLKLLRKLERMENGDGEKSKTKKEKKKKKSKKKSKDKDNESSSEDSEEINKRPKKKSTKSHQRRKREDSTSDSESDSSSEPQKDKRSSKSHSRRNKERDNHSKSKNNRSESESSDSGVRVSKSSRRRKHKESKHLKLSNTTQNKERNNHRKRRNDESESDRDVKISQKRKYEEETIIRKTSDLNRGMKKDIERKAKDNRSDSESSSGDERDSRKRKHEEDRSSKSSKVRKEERKHKSSKYN